MPGLVSSSRVVVALALISLSTVAFAQQPVNVYNPQIDIVQQGAAFRAFIEPGAPTMDVSVVNLGGSSALFRVGEETTLTEVLALSGAVAGTEENDRFIIRSVINVLRGDGQGGRTVIYSSAPEQLFREPGRHPQLQTGDVIEIDNRYERIPQRITLRDGVQIAATSLTLVLTIVNLLR